MRTKPTIRGENEVNPGTPGRVYGSPILFGTVLLVMLGDVVTTAVGLELGLHEGNPLVSLILVWFGLPGMLATKVVAAGVLLLLPTLTTESRWTFRVGSTVYLLVGILVLASNLWSIWSVIG